MYSQELLERRLILAPKSCLGFEWGTIQPLADFGQKLGIKRFGAESLHDLATSIEHAHRISFQVQSLDRTMRVTGQTYVWKGRADSVRGPNVWNLSPSPFREWPFRAMVHCSPTQGSAALRPGRSKYDPFGVEKQDITTNN
jgi:hypothetical protein